MTVEPPAAPSFVTPLKDICTRVVAQHFEEFPTFGNLPEKLVKKVVSYLALDLPLELVGTVIHDEDYWKRRASARWKNCEVLGHAMSWKQLYFERNLQDVLEQFDPATSDLDQLRRLMTFSKKFVTSLRLRQLPSHLDLQHVFDCMVNCPASLSVTYNLNDVGMDYDRSLFGMKLSDCRALARALERAECLTHLDLSSNGLDDDKVRMLASGLVDNITITHLCLAHNKIAERGIKALAKVLDHRSVLSVVDLHDNQIHVEGAKALSRALKSNQSLISLNLRMNRMGDDGCRLVCDSLRMHHTVQRLNLSANGAGEQTVASACQLLRSSRSLLELDLSCNALGPDSGNAFKKVLTKENTTLRSMDLRQSGLAADDELDIIEELRGRSEKKEKARVLGKPLVL